MDEDINQNFEGDKKKIVIVFVTMILFILFLGGGFWLRSYFLEDGNVKGLFSSRDSEIVEGKDTKLKKGGLSFKQMADEVASIGDNFEIRMKSGFRCWSRLNLLKAEEDLEITVEDKEFDGCFPDYRGAKARVVAGNTYFSEDGESWNAGILKIEQKPIVNLDIVNIDVSDFLNVSEFSSKVQVRDSGGMETFYRDYLNKGYYFDILGKTVEGLDGGGTFHIESYVTRVKSSAVECLKIQSLGKKLLNKNGEECVNIYEFWFFDKTGNLVKYEKNDYNYFVFIDFLGSKDNLSIDSVDI